MSAAEASGRYFMDTNVLVYTFDDGAPVKRDVARALLRDALSTGLGAISTQVVQEFLNVALRKFAQPMTTAQAHAYLSTVLLPLCQYAPQHQHYTLALALREETGCAFYDALILAAAVELKCSRLFSEDLHGRTVRGVTCVNPFVA
jgi:predicted nucleic acid-binding protein